jgi:hypothetical protein
MTWRPALRFLVELAVDLVRGKLERRDPPAAPPAAWRYLDSERAAKASRCAGHEDEPQCFPAKPPKSSDET